MFTIGEMRSLNAGLSRREAVGFVPPVLPERREGRIDIGRPSRAFPVTPPYIRIVYGGSADAVRVVCAPQPGCRLPVRQPRVHPRCRTQAQHLAGCRLTAPPQATTSLSTVQAFGKRRCGSAYLFLHLSVPECLTSLACLSPTMPSADFCNAVRKPLNLLSPCGTRCRSPGVRHRTFDA